MKQTAVEWFFYQLYTMEVEYEAIIKLYEQAKAMEKEQIMDAFDYGDSNVYDKDGEQYYNETFKSE